MEVPLLKTVITKEDILQLDDGFKRMVEEVYAKLPPEDKKLFHLFLFHTETYKAFFSLVYAVRLIALATNKDKESVPVFIPDWLGDLYMDTEVQFFYNLLKFVGRKEENGKTYLLWKNSDGKVDEYELTEVYARLAPYGIDNSFVYRYVSPDLLAFFIAYADSLENHLAQGGTLF